MGGYILRRALLVIPVVVGAVTLLFAAFLVTGDPVETIAGGQRAVSATTRAQIIHKYGLDEPSYVRYGRYIGRLVRGDLGDSYKQGRSVNDILRQDAPASLRLAIWAIILEILIGIAAGVIAAVRRYSFLDALTTVSTTMVVAIPVFVLGYLFQYVFGILPNKQNLGSWARFPVQGIGPNHWFLFIPLGNQWKFLLFPALTLASVSTAVVARMTRSTMLEVMKADYMRTAAAKGLTKNAIILKHGLKNAMIPVVTLIGLDLATLIGSAVITETVFNWPGMGSEIARAAVSLDAPVVLGLTTLLVVAYVVINLLVDLSYAFFDPRIRYGGAEAR
ncbi:MAG: binding-protein-dependent transport system inner rane component [Acidimicrobiales bacterium]|jgi:ABC-type dipeptide/oligopeptide/nickel transport system permease component|nr:binding-protein-dependent transport system inner rane component [Acidimicrobiales bacterium]